MSNIHDETLAELREVAEKGIGKLRKRTRTLLQVPPIVHYTPEEIKALRIRLKFTQAYFGELMGVSLKTIQSWEAGTNRPNGTALRVFQMLDKDPNALIKYIYTEASGWVARTSRHFFAVTRSELSTTRWIDIYDMTQAVEDGAIRLVYYESRVMNLGLNEDVLRKIDKTYE